MLPDGAEIQYTYYDGNPAGEPNTGRVSEISATPADVTNTFLYDGSLMTNEAWSGTVEGQVDWTYNNDLEVESFSVNSPEFFTGTLGYDGDGLVTSVTATSTAGVAEPAFSVQRDVASGLVVGTVLDNVSTQRSYNDFGELASLTASVDGVTVFESTYHSTGNPRDKLGRIVDLAETSEGLTHRLHYEYGREGTSHRRMAGW